MTCQLQDPDSVAIINNLTTPHKLEDLMTPAGNQLSREILGTLGWTDLNQSTYEALIESAHQSNCEIYLAYKGGVMNPIAMWITTTDETGGKDTSNAPVTVANIGDCINIQ